MTRRRTRALRALLVGGAGSLIVACSSGSGSDTPPPDAGTPDAGSPPFFPADYATTFKQVRNCRQSGDHDLNRVRILADPAAFDPYQKRDQLFPVGAVVLKEEYDFADTACSGPVKQWTVMKRVGPRLSPRTLDWRWQRVDTQRRVVGEDTPRCYGCHAGCTVAAGGYENTCAVP